LQVGTVPRRALPAMRASASARMAIRAPAARASFAL